ncbi:MAG: acetate--CoA ligase family protein [Candidatus Marinimicrobia bacterium]|nr:acetate--CoA ligase family protein [Candidatus Neomarinimicrobiota bacterium]
MSPKSHLREHMEKIFYPESVAVVGATKVPGTVPHDIIHNILKADFQGIVYPVSPKEKFIAGAKCYKYIVDIDDPIDLAIIVFPSSVADMALEQCGNKGVKSVIIISAGFREVGGKGIEKEQKILEIADKYDINFIGPNCLGVINTDPKSMLNASFARKMPEEGTIGFLSQSGALCTAVLDYAQAKHIGFSKFISFGNKADINEIDLLRYLKDDPKTKVILMYLEEVSKGRELMDVAREIIKDTGKPILAIKSGRTDEGASAAASHTGSLAGSDLVTDAAFKQAGIIRCNNIEEMFNKAIAMAYQPMPKSNNIAIITNAGGPGVLTTDAAIHEGLELAKFSDQTTAVFKKYLPKTANIKNPVDVIGDARADRYKVALSQALKDVNVDGAFVILTPQSMTDIDTIATEIVNVAEQYDKPLYASFMGEADVASGIDILQRNKIPHYSLPESMCKSFATAYKFENHKLNEIDRTELYNDVDKESARKIIDDAIKKGKKILPENEADRVLETYGIPVPERKLVTSAEEAAKVAVDIGFPVVLKIMSEDITHKFDVKGVVIDLHTEKETKDAYESIMHHVTKFRPDAKIDGILVEKMVPKGQEVILGIKRDPAFGPFIMYGLGGIFVEVFKDVSFRVAPIDKNVASEIIEETKSSKMLHGTRGIEPADVDALQNTLIRLGQLAVDCPQIKELDINPLIVLEKGKGCFVADANIML